jgi:hypothetical protein
VTDQVSHPYKTTGSEDKIKMDHKNLDLERGARMMWLRIGTGSCECGNEHPGSIKHG